jgi:hypothetical protein
VNIRLNIGWMVWFHVSNKDLILGKTRGYSYINVAGKEHTFLCSNFGITDL